MRTFPIGSSNSANSTPNTNYSLANLKNLMDAFAGLYVLEMSYMKYIGTQDDIESFIDYSELFVKAEGATSKEIDEMVERAFDMGSED